MTEQSTQHKIAFIGLGNMNAAILSGMLSAGFERENLWGTVGSSSSAQAKSAEFGIDVLAGEDSPTANADAVQQADVVVLGVKPYAIVDTCTQIAPTLQPHTVVVSVAAGIGLDSMEATLPAGQPVVRAMPNVALTVGQGAVGVAANEQVSQDQLALVTSLFAPAGEVVTVPESQINAVGAVSGSGPAYFFYLAELLAQHGQQLGLDPENAEKLASATLTGAGTMMSQPDAEAAALRRSVTSPNGTTEAAIKSLDADGLSDIVSKALQANVERSEQMAAQ